MNDHFVCVRNTHQRYMVHPGSCDEYCEYHNVVLDGQTFEGMRTGLYRLVGFDPDSWHPFIAWSQKVVQ